MISTIGKQLSNNRRPESIRNCFPSPVKQKRLHIYYFFVDVTINGVLDNLLRQWKGFLGIDRKQRIKYIKIEMEFLQLKYFLSMESIYEKNK